jgi:hypothetical protein
MLSFPMATVENDQRPGQKSAQKTATVQECLSSIARTGCPSAATLTTPGQMLSNWYTGVAVENRTFGNMTVVGQWPATLLKALTIIADTLHPAFDRQLWMAANQSKRTCILAALAAGSFS